MRTRRLPKRSSPTVPLLAIALAAVGCGGSTGASPTGQSDFESAPPGGSGGGSHDSAFGAGGSPSAAGGVSQGASVPPLAAGSGIATQPRTVQETDLYRLDGNRLYYLNGYRGLMVFDLTNVDQPKLLGRYAIFGTPVQMVVNSGIATVVVADWIGKRPTGEPFHGSIVQGLDATDPTNIKFLGQALLGGWVQDTRIVGDVLYAVSEDWGWVYGWGGGPIYAGGAGVAVSAPAAGSAGGVAGPIGAYAGPDVIVSSVSFAGGQITEVSHKTYSGYGGVFNVTPNSILLAHPAPPVQPNLPRPAKTDLAYLDISDPGGTIVERGTIEVDGSIEGWGADNGRWNLDFADGKTAHVLGCAGSVYGCGQGYVLATADFSNPDKPAIASTLSIPATNGWTPATRFDGTRMYLSPTNYAPAGGTTPLEIYDVSNPAAPALAGQTQIPGSVWLMIPSGNQLFALGQDNTFNASQVSLKYLDVTNASSPKLLGTSNFGDGWAWTPAASTFKAFTHDPTQGLVVLPFSGWSSINGKYNNGVQLIEFTPTSIMTAGAAHTRGWVERGIFANHRIVSLSDLALSVVDYTDPLAPTVTAELTLARNVVAAQPAGSTVAEVSSDWWGNDTTQSDVRALPIADAAENLDESQAPDVQVNGVNARVFTNGSFAYVVTSVEAPVPCDQFGSLYGGKAAPSIPPGGPQGPQVCTAWHEEVQVVDVSSATVKARGKPLALQPEPFGWYGGWGWGGFYYYDWFNGGDIVQVNGDILAFRRWHSNYGPSGQYISAFSDLFVVDLSNPDQPSLSSVVITRDVNNSWWGNMKVVNSKLYVTHTVWSNPTVQNPIVRYYLDEIDLSDRAHPGVKTHINVPGILVGGSASDPSVLYTIDYRYDTNAGPPVNDLAVVKLSGDKAYLQSRTALDGWVGNVFVRGSTAYMSTQKFVTTYTANNPQPGVELHQIDLSDPAHPVDRIASGQQGWGWLVDVQGDRALVTSGWANQGLDIYRLSPNAAPAYDQFVRTQGWSLSSIARQGNQLFLSSGDWGVQVVNLQ